MKYICDGCGKEIVVNPIAIFAEEIDRETEGIADCYYVPDKDFCEDCMKRIIHFIDGLPTENMKKPGVLNLEIKQAVQQTSQEPDKKVIKVPLQPKIQKLLGEGKTVEEILEKKKYKCSEVQESCAYMGKAGTAVICDFIGKEGHRRGCPAEECTVYQKVER
jgi:hypothetical protein